MPVVVVGLVLGLLPQVPALAARPWSPASPSRTSVPVGKVKPKPRTIAQSERSAVTSIDHRAWPKGGSGRVATGAGPVLVGGVPVSIAAHAARGSVLRWGGSSIAAADGLVPATTVDVPTVDVTMLPQSAADAVGVKGVVFTASLPAGEPASTVAATLNYSSFANAYGANFGSRLRLVQLPDCALTTPDLPECQTQTALESTNTPDVVSGDLTVEPTTAGAGATSTSRVAAGDVTDTSGGTVFALSSSPSSSVAGNFAATSLSQANAWSAGNQAGTFDMSIPLKVPASLGGPAPDLSLDYDSGSVDGKTAKANGQSSWLGDGWDLSTDFIETSYRSCRDDGHATDDLCQFSPYNATMVFQGRSVQLVYDTTAAVWHSTGDDAIKIDQLAGTGAVNAPGTNGDKQNRYWRVTTQDGTQYFFGIGHRYVGDTGMTNGTLTVPVFGNNSGELCYSASGFAASWCHEAYRWNLDYVVDTAGNSMTYNYVKYIGYVGLNGNTNVRQYDITGTLDTITYGQKAGTEAASPAPMEVVFGANNRCINTCQANTTDYPDTPFDLMCTSGTSCPNTMTPIFFTRYQLGYVVTKVYTGGAYRSVDSWNMAYTFPSSGDLMAPTGDDTSPNLWLASIYHTGYAADGVTNIVENTMFTGGTRMANRVKWGTDVSQVPYERYRLTSMTNGTGGETDITYATTPCARADIPSDQSHNSKLCFPQGPISGPDWFQKYTVTQVKDRDLTGGSPDEVWSYAYDNTASDDTALWHSDYNETAALTDRTWSQFDGFSKVTVTHGATGGPQTVTTSIYHRGMHLDATLSGSTINWNSRYVHTLAPVGTPNVTAPIEGLANKCLAVSGDGTANGTHEVLWDCNGGTGQSWMAQADGTIKNPPSGRCLNLVGGGTAAGTLLEIRDCTAAASEIWQPQPDGSLMNPISGKCLAVTGGNSANNTPIELWTCNSGTAQLWYSQLNDSYGLQGHLVEQASWDGTQLISSSIHNYTATTVATRAAPETGGSALAAQRVLEVSDHTRTWLPVTSTWRWTQTDTSYNTYANPTTVTNLGDLAVASDDTCTITSYVTPDTTQWLINFPSQMVTTDCAGTPGDADYLAGSQILYDGSVTVGATPTKGLVTKTTALATVLSGTMTWKQASRSGYDANGRVVDAWDALDRNTHTAYTPATGGPVTGTTVTNPMGWNTVTTIEPGHGSVTSVVDANSKTTSVSYDPLGRTSKVWLNNRATTLTADRQYTYTLSASAPSWVEAQALGPNGTQVASFTIYDGRLRPRQAQTPTPVGTGGRTITDTQYDGRGLTAKTSTFYNNTTGPSSTLATFTDGSVPTQDRYTYDNLQRQTADAFYSLNTQEWTTTTAYQQDRTTVTPPAGAMPSTTILDAAGNTTQLRQYTTTNTGGTYQATNYTYDRLNRLIATTDSVGNTWTSTYDLRGRVTGTTDPDSGTVANTYDDAGQLLTTTDGRPVTLAYAYDNLGRRTDTYLATVGGTHLDKWVYDTLAKGQLTSSTEWRSGNAFTSTATGYDDAYRPLGTTIGIPASEGTAITGNWTTSTAYNVDGSVASTTYPTAGGMGAETVTNTYDNNGYQLTATSSLDTYLSNATYQTWGALYQATLGTGTKRVQVTTDQYADTHRTKLISVGTEHPGTPGTFDEQSTQYYNWTNAGTITSIDGQHAGATVDSQCFTYDYLQRLTTAFTTTPALGGCAATPSTSTVGGTAPYWQTYAYDPTGNRTSLISHGLGGTGDTTSTYTYPTPGTAKAHTLTSVATTGPAGNTSNSYTYGGVGQITNQTIAGLSTDFAYNNQARNTTATIHAVGGNQITTYLYLADGTEIMRDTPTGKTLYLPGQEIATDATGTNITGVTRYYTACGRSVASRVQGGPLSWLAGDHQNTAQVAVDQTSQAVTIRRQDPFGNPRGTVPNWPNSRGFVGGTTEPSGLIHLGARMYDPATGRFVSDDPVRQASDPQQINGYTYANNNPVNASDPTGLLVAPVACADDGPCSTNTTANPDGAKSGHSHDMTLPKTDGSPCKGSRCGGPQGGHHYVHLGAVVVDSTDPNYNALVWAYNAALANGLSAAALDTLDGWWMACGWSPGACPVGVWRTVNHAHNFLDGYFPTGGTMLVSPAFAKYGESVYFEVMSADGPLPPGEINYSDTASAFGSDDATLSNFGRSQGARGYHDVFMHGDEDYPNGDPASVTPEELANGIRANPSYSGQPIRLCMCHAGSTGFAQDLANIMGVNVEANTGLVAMSIDGELIGAPGTLTLVFEPVEVIP